MVNSGEFGLLRSRILLLNGYCRAPRRAFTRNFLLQFEAVKNNAGIPRRGARAAGNCVICHASRASLNSNY